MEPVLLLGKERFQGVDIRVRVKGGGRIAQIYAIRQAISKSLVSYYQKCELTQGSALDEDCYLNPYPLGVSIYGRPKTA